MINDSTNFELIINPTNQASGSFCFRNKTNILGNFSVNVTVIDDAGWWNYSIINFGVDNLAPTINITVPSTNASSGIVWLNGTVNGTGSTLLLYFNESKLTVMENPNGSVVDSFALMNNSFIPDGNLTVNLTIVDQSGLNFTIIKTIQIDNHPPSINIINIVNGSIITESIIWINGTVNDTNTLILTFQVNDSRFEIQKNPVGQRNSQFAIWNSTDLLDGTYYLRINAADAANNLNYTVINFTIDNLIGLDPQLLLTSPENDNDGISGQTLVIEGMAYGISSNIDKIWINDSLSWIIDVNPAGLAQGAFRFVNLTIIVDGFYVVNITLNNTEGNSYSFIRLFYVDNLIPSINCSNLRYDGDALSGNTIEFVGFANGTITSIYNLTMNDSRFVLMVDPSGSSWGNYRFINNTVIPDGLLLVEINISDDMGLYYIFIVSCLVDNSNPPTPSHLTHSVIGGIVYLYWDSVSDLTNVTYLIYRNSINIVNLTTNSCTDQDLPPGTYYYEVFVMDNAGNLCATAATMTVNIPGSRDPNLDFFILLIILLIIFGAVAVSAVGITFYRRRSKTSTEPSSKKSQIKWFNDAVRYSPKLENKLVEASEKPQKLENIRDAEMLSFLNSPLTTISPEIMKKVDQLPISEPDKIELFQSLLNLPPDEREELIDEIFEEEMGGDL